MKELAIFGIVMMVIIAIALQHLANWMFREEDGMIQGLITLIGSLMLLGYVFLIVIKHF